MKNIVIPDSLQITMDDLGWFCGEDGREKMEPARAGVKRNHEEEDYEVVNELGRRLGMKINCAFMLGEWDMDNRLKNIPHLSPYGENWDNASRFDKEKAKRFVDIINTSPYIDIAHHGLHHSYYIPGNVYSNSDFYFLKDGKWNEAPEDEVRMKIEAFYDIYELNGFKKEITSFVPPNFTYHLNHLSPVLKEYGILYLSTIFDRIEPKTENLSSVEIENDIITVDRTNNLIDWDEMESNPLSLPDTVGIFGCHWANICHKDPKKNYTLVDNWVKYFERCKGNFGTILSTGISFHATQLLYKKYSAVKNENGVFAIDVSGVPKHKGMEDSFYISSEEVLENYSGCELEIYEKQKNFINYKVTPKGNILKFK